MRIWLDMTARGCLAAAASGCGDVGPCTTNVVPGVVVEMVLCYGTAVLVEPALAAE